MRAQRSISWCLLLSLVGIGLSGYLVYLHLGLMRGELLGGPACGSSGVLNCHLVTGSSWGSFLGLPLALWGVLGYVVVLALSLLARQSSEWTAPAMTALFSLAVLLVTIDMALFGLMVFVIHAFCLFCLATYAVNLVILFLTARALERPWPQALGGLGTAVGALIPSRQRQAAWLFWGVLVVGVLGVAGVHAATLFVSRGTFGSMQRQIREFVTKQPRVSLEVAGDPMIGAAGAPLRIVEFSDFFCPACQRASKLNRIIISNHHRDAVFIFKHYPLDMSCNAQITRMVHPGACQVAAASECVHLQGKFWPFHDLVFEDGPKYNAANLEGDVRRLGIDVAQFNACMSSGDGMAAVQRDIAEAGKAGVTSTPTYVINGLPVAGGLTPAMFDDFVAVLRETGS